MGVVMMEDVAQAVIVYLLASSFIFQSRPSRGRKFTHFAFIACFFFIPPSSFSFSFSSFKTKIQRRPGLRSPLHHPPNHLLLHPLNPLPSQRATPRRNKVQGESI